MNERYHDADALLSSIPDVRLPRVTLQTLRANLRLAQGKYDQASKFADEALAEVSTKLPPTTGEAGRVAP